jgi:hypothetical protein
MPAGADLGEPDVPGGAALLLEVTQHRLEHETAERVELGTIDLKPILISFGLTEAQASLAPGIVALLAIVRPGRRCSSAGGNSAPA